MPSHRKISRFSLFLALPLLVSLAALMPEPALAGKHACSDRPIFLQEVSVRERSGIDADGIHADYLPALEKALEKKGFLLVERGGGVALEVKVRAWTSRTATGRTLLELASSVRVMEGDARLWKGEVLPGEISRLLHAKHSDTGNLAKRTAELVADACRSGWTLK